LATAPKHWPGTLARFAPGRGRIRFHGATLDLRQSSDVLESVVAELLAQAEPVPTTARSGRRTGEAADARTGAMRGHAFRAPRLLGRTRGELDVFRRARELRAQFGARAIDKHIVSHTESLSDLLEVALLRRRRPAGRHRVALLRADGGPLFETIADSNDRRHHTRVAGARGLRHLLVPRATAGRWQE